MARSRRKPRITTPFDRGAARPYADDWRRPYRVLTVKVALPLSVSRRARNEVYTYPMPRQRQRMTRHIRVPLQKRKEPYRVTRIRIALPRVLPSALRSKVAVRAGHLVIYGSRNVERTFQRLELNRRYYGEHKSNVRQARWGQLDSPGADRFGIVAEAARRGLSIGRIADAALVARALRRRS